MDKVRIGTIPVPSVCVAVFHFPASVDCLASVLLIKLQVFLAAFAVGSSVTEVVHGLVAS